MSSTNSASCPAHYCISVDSCLPRATECETRYDCTKDACCIVKDLNVLESNIPGRALPGEYMEHCQPDPHHRRSVYCQVGRCVTTIPDWFHVSDTFTKKGPPDKDTRLCHQVRISHHHRNI
jgi:hypothetical protein